MAEQDQVFTKCAWRLIPFMGLLYLVSFIDRTNAGFAALTMNKDLGFSPTVFGFGAGIFFIGYALFQVPANVILERIGARRWVFCIMAVWGLLSASNALVQTPISFYVVRFLLGVAEAGFVPGMFLYLTYWFPRGYLARFTAYFMIANPLSFVIGGPISSLILGMDGVAGLHGWQWMFLMEGLPAFLLAFAVLKFLPDGPARAAWLTSEEKDTIAARLATEEPAGRPDLWSALRDPRVLALGIAYFVFNAAAVRNLLVAAADRAGDGLLQYRHRLCRRIVFCGGYSRDDPRRAFEFQKGRTHLACGASLAARRIMPRCRQSHAIECDRTRGARYWTGCALRCLSALFSVCLHRSCAARRRRVASASSAPLAISVHF